MKKFPLFFTIIVGALCTYNVKADGVECPAGCFCLNNGKSNSATYTDVANLCSESAMPNIPGGSQAATYCENISISTNREMFPATYYYEDFSEFYEGELGFYGIINDEFVYHNSCPNSEHYDGIFQCPYTYPNSAPGAKALGECFKYDVAGNKIYYGANNYGNCNIDGIRTTVANLQRALAEAAENLQNALNTSSPQQLNAISVPFVPSSNNTTKSSKNVGKSAIPKATTMKAAKTLK